MAAMVSSWSKNVDSVPTSYIMPAESRAEKLVTICKDIPVIDLSRSAGRGRGDIVMQIVKACEEYGFFQVINHGVPEDTMHEAMKVCNDFFNLSVEDKESLYSEKKQKSCILYTSSTCYTEEEVHSWKDVLVHPCHPLDQHIPSWPEKPDRYRQVVGAYSVEVRKLGLKLLDLICEGLGLKEGYFGEDLSKEQLMAINHFPSCPDPSLTLGLVGHHDPSVISVVQQDSYGLQIFKGGQWVGVEPVPNALVVSACHQMEVISNGKLKSMEHRVVTNSTNARSSIVSFFNPSLSAVIEPAKELVSDDEPPLFKPFTFSEYLQTYRAYLNMKIPRPGTPLDSFELIT